MPDDDTAPLPDWARDLKPPPPVPENVRQWLIGMEIRRQQDNYKRNNPQTAGKQSEQGNEEGE